MSLQYHPAAQILAPPVALRSCTAQTLLLSQKTNISPHFI